MTLCVCPQNKDELGGEGGGGKKEEGVAGAALPSGLVPGRV